jgi:hypothetical protein
MSDGGDVPTILRVLGFRFFFYSLEPGEPPHVHVASGGKSAKYWLDPVELANSEGFRAHELSRVRDLVNRASRRVSEEMG